MAYVKRCMIVAAPYVETARSLAEGLAGPAGAGMFMFPLSQDGLEPATHYLTEGHIEEMWLALLTDSAALEAACQEAGITMSLEQCVALLAACDVSEEGPFTAIERLGLKPIMTGDVNA